MRLVYKFYIRHTDELDRLFRISNNLYNQALYLFRQRLDADGVWTWYNDMDKLIKGVTNLEGECNYKLRYFLRESPSLQGWDDSRLPAVNWRLS